MQTLKKITTAIIIGLPLFLASSCAKKLQETPYDQVVTDNFYNNKNEVLSAVLRPYTHANAWATPGQDGWWRLSELSADQLAWPVKGRHGQDGGKWLRLHYHSWTPDDDFVTGAWRLMWWGLGLCTDPIQNLEKRSNTQMGITQQEKDAYIAELRLLRAFHYIKLLDLYGNIPIVTKIGEPTSPPTAPRKDVFNFIEKEIKECIDKAPLLSRAMLGRMTQASGYAMLTELYLNAEKWSGTPRWDDCIAAADKLINGQAGGLNGAAQLDVNLTDTYKPTNFESKEILFQIAYEFQISNFQPQWPGDFYHFDQDKIYGGNRTGNDGVVIIPGVYTTFDNADKRKKEWILAGPMWRYDNPTQPVICTGNNEYKDEQLVFVDNIRKNKQNSTVSDMTQGEENSGVRFNKYKLGATTDKNYNSCDWAVYRLSWIYFAKAEAIMRKSGGIATQEAVNLINAVRQRAFTTEDWPTKAYTTTTLTMDELLAERGREFIFEGFRRQDLMRSNKFTTGVWWDHQPTQNYRQLFPIPRNQRNINKNLAQNEGYD